MELALLAAGAVLSALQAIRVQRLLSSALWLAGTSAITALLLYRLGAPEIAVIELSVGAGLVTVLLVFAISLAGEEKLEVRSPVPRWLAWALAGLCVSLLAWQLAPASPASSSVPEEPFAQVLWQDRGLDLLVQVALIFAGMLGVLGLLTEEKATEEVSLQPIKEELERETLQPIAERAEVEVVEAQPAEGKFWRD